ncbi:unnamed protein product [Chilo suppressalis]|uniref:Glycoside hydrolase family 38 central domain-containing protein n=1 Tax=Chilo suppressalis TaxID=168631 RepID=A0ABN8B638_CHISP|nr:unnamed protein product [Chilo suppressalis]
MICSVLNTRYADVQVRYSTPACYLKAVYDSSPELQTKQDDFLPFAYDRESYAVGMYTSRPSVKYLAREGHRYLQIAKQLQVMARLPNNDKIFEEYHWINGAFQDHNIITGEMRHYVYKYYVDRMNKATNMVVTNILETGFNILRNNTAGNQAMIRCKLNVSRCHCTEGKHMFIVVYNPLAWPVSMPIRLPMFQVEQVVYDPKGKKVRAGQIELPEPVREIPERQSRADFELVFIAEDLPPMGIRSYYLQRRQLGWERPKRSPKVHNKKNKKKKKLHSRSYSPLNVDTAVFDELVDYEYFEDATTTEAYNPDTKTEINDVATSIDNDDVTITYNSATTSKNIINTTSNSETTTKVEILDKTTKNNEETLDNNDNTIDSTTSNVITTITIEKGSLNYGNYLIATTPNNDITTSSTEYQSTSIANANSTFNVKEVDTTTEAAARGVTRVLLGIFFRSNT